MLEIPSRKIQTNKWYNRQFSEFVAKVSKFVSLTTSSTNFLQGTVYRLRKRTFLQDRCSYHYYAWPLPDDRDHYCQAVIQIETENSIHIFNSQDEVQNMYCDEFWNCARFWGFFSSWFLRFCFNFRSVSFPFWGIVSSLCWKSDIAKIGARNHSWYSFRWRDQAYHLQTVK